MSNTTNSLPFKEWFKELRKLAKYHDLEWLVPDEESFLEAYQDGMTPAEALESEADEARSLS